MPFAPTGPLVAGRNLRPAGLITDSGGTYRTPAQTAIVSVSALQVHFANWYAGLAGTGDVNGPNAYTVKAYLEHNGALTQITFAGGVTSISVAPGETVAGTATKTITAGDTYYIRSYVTPDVEGGSYPRLYAVVDFGVEMHRKAADHANELGTTNLTQYGNVFGPIAITGTVTDGPRFAVALLGDSITNGDGDDFSAPSHVGFGYRALDGHRPFQHMTLAGEQAAQYVAQGATRQAHIGPAVHYVICQYGLNDLQGGRTLAQTQAALLAIWSAAVALNPTVRCKQTTITPKSASTDGWTTTVNQTPDGTVEPIRPGLNAWIRAGAPIIGGVAVAVGTPGALLAGQPGHPLHGYLEIADLAEPSRDSGKWKAGYTSDGIHPNVTGHLALVPGVDLNVLADVPLSTSSGPVRLISQYASFF